MDQKLKEALIGIAHQDLRDVRAEGALSIVDTKVGAIHMSYNKASDDYTMTYGETTVRASKDAAVRFLVDNYEVEGT